MKKSFLKWFCCFVPLGFLACAGNKPATDTTVLEQAKTETIKKVHELIAEKKYESAFVLLDSIDSQNSQPDIVLLKEDIALNYFVTSFMHQAFAFKDIAPNEDIMDYRGTDGSYKLHLFQVDSILENLIKIEPDNCKLYKGLGDFYSDVYSKYTDRWLKNDSELFTLIQTNVQKAIDGNCADYQSYYDLGFINLVQEKYKESIPYFLKSIEMNNERAVSHYNLAYAYLYADDHQNALKYAKNALEIYTDLELKGDAARMLGQIYKELKDTLNAVESYELANKIEPENYYTIKALLRLYVKTSNKKAEEITNVFFNLAPENPAIYNDLEDIFYESEKENDLIAFFKSQLSVFKDNDIVQGLLNFYLGKIYLETDKKVAQKYFLESKENVGKILDKDHPMLISIEEGIKRCE